MKEIFKKSKILGILTLIATIVIVFLQNNADPDFEKVEVVRVVDGDTIIVNDGLNDYRVRLILVDTPETVHPNKPVEFYGKEASDFTKKNLEGKRIYMEKDVSDTDRYGRLLRYIWTEKPLKAKPTNKELREKNFNARLLLEGYGNISTFPPDIKYEKEFLKFEQEARQNNLGLWGKEEYIPEEEENSNQNMDLTYIGNKNSKVFHYPDCSSVINMKEENKIYLDTRTMAIDQGFKPCGTCKP